MPVAQDRPTILVLPPILVAGTLLIGILLHYWVWTFVPFPLIPSRVMGFTIFVLAGLLAHWAQSAMKSAGTNILPTRPSTALVENGPFRISRNPLYIAALGVYVGVALWVDGLVPLLLLPVVFIILTIGIVMPEERYLDEKFGESYRSYRARVRRWI
jgi:protein-S-isoprenylcysteine O-methyltransferase Ste14